MRVAFAGPSGTGKTTLANYIEENSNLIFTPNSASLMFTEEDKEVLRKLGYTFSGHKEVIQLSNINPKFAKEFQSRLLLRRGEFIERSDDFIIDRSPIDNLVYMLYQVGYNATQEFVSKFYKQVEHYLHDLNHIIFIPTTNQDGIEDNGSRIASYPFQRMMSGIFEFALNEYDIYSAVRVTTIDYWDLSKRKEEVKQLLRF